MSIISVLTSYFLHSNLGQHHLKDEMAIEVDTWGIQIGSATRFSSFATHSKSIVCCFPAIQWCIASSAVKFDTKAVYRHSSPRILWFSLTFRQSHCLNMLKVQNHSVSNYNLLKLLSLWHLLPKGSRPLKVKALHAQMSGLYSQALLSDSLMSFLMWESLL